MSTKETKEYKKTISLDKRQREILVGLLLGDAHMEKVYTPSHKATQARLLIEHSYKQKEYVDWLYNEFKNWTSKAPRKREKKGWSNKNYYSYVFTTYGHTLLGEFQERFYRERKKIVPNGLEKDITDLGLAVWYMDDGSIKSRRHKGVFFNTHTFSIEDMSKLQKVLQHKFRIESTTRNDKNGKQIYLGGESGEKLMSLIRPYIISSMQYKIPRVLR